MTGDPARIRQVVTACGFDPPPWARHVPAWHVVTAVIAGRWRLAVLRGWATTNSHTWCAALEFRHEDGDPVGVPNPFEGGEAGPTPDEIGVARGWCVYIARWLTPAPEPPANPVAPEPAG